MNRNSSWKWLLMMVALLVLVAGCGKQASPQSTIQSALVKSMELQSYTFSGSVNVEKLTLPNAFLQSEGPEAQLALNLLQNMTIDVKGSHQIEPMRMELTADIALKGDFSFNLSIPMIITEDTMLVKVPNIPMLPLGDLAGKYIEIDMNELAKEENLDIPSYNPETQQKLVQDMISIILKHLDGEQYFQSVKLDEATGLPSDLKLDEAVKVSVTQTNFEAAVIALAEKAAPEFIELVAQNEEYMKALNLKKQDIEDAKKELTPEKLQEVKKDLEDIKKELTINELSMLGGIQDGYMTYQHFKADLSFKVDNEDANLVLNMTSRYDNLNKPIEKQADIPKDQIIPYENLMEMGDFGTSF